MRLQKKISTLVHRYVPSNLTLSDSGVIIGSSAAINLLMFAYNAYLGRKLVIADFGLVTFIGSLLNVLYIPLGSFARTITHWRRLEKLHKGKEKTKYKAIRQCLDEVEKLTSGR